MDVTSTGLTFLELLLDELQLVGPIALLPVVGSRAGLLREVNPAGPVGLGLLTAGAVVGIPLGHHGLIRLAILGEGHHQLGRACTKAAHIAALFT